MQEAVRFNDTAIVTVKGNGYKIPVFYINKDKALLRIC